MSRVIDPVPAPTTMQAGDGTVVLPGGARVVADPALRPAARWWRRVTEDAFGIDIALDLMPDLGPSGAGPGANVTFAVGQGLPAGGYRLEIDDAVRVVAADLAGAHAAAQTLRQLAGPQAFRRAGSEPLELPRGVVTDAPRHGWRGVLLDVARHFLPKADVLRFIDLAAAHHLNVVQLHLTDDQGWRIEIERYPRLTEVGSWRRESTVGTWRAGAPDGRPHGGYYTLGDLREIVTYARGRGVTVVPEIDVPGHVQAVLAAYPELAARQGRHDVRTTWGISEDVLDPSPAAVEFFRGVLDEVCAVFDSPYVALGGDEVPTTAWRERPDVVARAGELGLVHADGSPDVARLHGWFLAQLAEHLRSNGRRAVVWDEAFGPDLPRDVVVTCWRGYTVAADALAAGHDVVLAPEQATYLDHRAGVGADEPIPVGFLRTVADVYGFEPLPAGLVASRPELAGELPGTVLGGQAQVWTEHLDSARRIDYAAFPRLAAFAEAVWSTTAADRSPGSAASDEFLARLRTAHLPRLDAAGGWAGVGGWLEGQDV